MLEDYDFDYGQTIKTHVEDLGCNRQFLANHQISAEEAVAAAADGIHAAKACPAINVAASSVIKAASAITDILTIANTVALGVAGNALKVLLTTAEDDNLAVTKDDTSKTITIALAKTTAAKNTATLVQAAIRALTSVGGVSVAAVTCTAGGNWDTAAVATGETGSISFTGGLSPVDEIITDITNPPYPRNVTATAGGTAGHIKAIQVTVEGTNFNNEAISEALPAFTVDTPGIVTGNKAFKTITKISIPAHDGTGATTAIGFGDKLGLPYKLARNTVMAAYLNKALEVTAPTVAVNATALENNTVDLASALDGHAVDIDLRVPAA